MITCTIDKFFKSEKGPYEEEQDDFDENIDY
jgi:hypothetical protein